MHNRAAKSNVCLCIVYSTNLRTPAAQVRTARYSAMFFILKLLKPFVYKLSNLGIVSLNIRVHFDTLN